MDRTQEVSHLLGPPDGDNNDDDDTPGAVRGRCATIDHLPDEVLALILRWLPCADRRTSESVDRRWRALLRDAHLGPPPCIVALNDQAATTAFYARMAKADAAIASDDGYETVYMHEPSCAMHANRLVDAAAHGRHISVARLSAGGAPKYRAACLVAASYGYLLVVKALFRNRPHKFPLSDALERAARCGHIQVIKYLLAKMSYVPPRLCERAARGGHLEVLVYLRQSGARWDAQVFRAAAKSGRLAVFRYLDEYGCPRGYSPLDEAFARGHVEIVDHGLTHGFEVDSDSQEKAASNNRLDVLLVARDHGLLWTAEVCSGAAAGGHLDLIKRARADGCPWNENTCSQAARYGHLDILAYAVENGCPMGAHTIWQACTGGHLDCLTYAHQHGAPLAANDCWVAASNGHRQCMEYVHAQGLCGRSCRRFFPQPRVLCSDTASCSFFRCPLRRVGPCWRQICV